ncbi:MAG: hypothetical protein ABIT08_05415 [Bacteroidia bacterium]
MKSDSIKLELIEWLTALEDKQILQSLFFYKNIQKKTDWWDDLTKEQLHEIEKGIKDIKAGKTVSSSVVWQKYGRKPKH